VVRVVAPMIPSPPAIYINADKEDDYPQQAKTPK
jgi:hypothetical protein